MRLEVFTEIINAIDRASKRSFAANQLGIDLIEYDTDLEHAVWTAIRAHYGKAGADWIEWYVYERPSLSGDDCKAWDKDGNEICNTIESLWQTVEEIRLSPDFKEYELPAPSKFDENSASEMMENLFKKAKK